VESVAVTWRGKFKRVNDLAVNACPTQGRTQFVVVEDNAALRAGWRNTPMPRSTPISAISRCGASGPAAG
jgi:hypothetical protein